jgi:hypothetical protein
MKAKTTQCLLEVSQSEAVNTPVMGTLVKEGLTLPNSVTEDIGGFSLAPRYSTKQLRQINKRLKYKNRQSTKSAKKQWRFTSAW